MFSKVAASILISVLMWCLDNEQLARSGINCLESFAVTFGLKFDSKTWDKVDYALSATWLPYIVLCMTTINRYAGASAVSIETPCQPP